MLMKEMEFMLKKTLLKCGKTNMYKSIKDFSGANALNEKLKMTCYNFRPDMIIFGHADVRFNRSVVKYLEQVQPKSTTP